MDREPRPQLLQPSFSSASPPISPFQHISHIDRAWNSLSRRLPLRRRLTAMPCRGTAPTLHTTTEHQEASRDTDQIYLMIIGLPVITPREFPRHTHRHQEDQA